MNGLQYIEHQSKSLKKEHFTHLVKIALADGLVDNSEHELLQKFGKKLNLTEQEVELLIATPGKTTFHPPYHLSERFDQIYDIVKLILVNGNASQESMRIANCYVVAAGFEISEADKLIHFLVKGIQEGKDEDELLYEYKLERITH